MEKCIPPTSVTMNRTKLTEWEIKELFLDLPLYHWLDIEFRTKGSQAIIAEDSKHLFFQLHYGRIGFDCYCLDCRKENHFDSPSTSASIVTYLLGDRVFTRAFTCLRDERHLIHFMYAIKSHKIAKVGQVPTTADLCSDELRKYSKVLDKESYA